MTEEDVPDYLQLVNQLHDDFSTFQEGRRQVHLKKHVPHPRFAVLYGLACQTDMLSREALPLLDTDDPRPRLAAVPIVRSVYETGLTAQWVAGTPLAEYRIAKKHRDVQREVTTALRLSANPLFREAAEHREDRYDESQFDMPDGTPPSAGVKAICESLEGGNDLYLIYRMLCGNTHPGVEAIDVWLNPNENSGVALRPYPREPWREALDAVCLWGVLWASVALDDVVKNSPRRNLLNRTAGRSQAVLRLSPTR